MDPPKNEEAILLPADDSVELGPSPELRGDSLADSVVILLTLTVLQRVIGFSRSVLFCRWLSETELGQWDITFSFLMLAAPVSMLALPSCLNRYFEYYRQRGHARTLIRRVSLGVLSLGLISSSIIFLGREPFSLLIYGTPDHTQMVALLAACLMIIIVTHLLIELLNALRYVRVLSVVHLGNSLAFAVFGAVLILGVPNNVMDQTVSVVLAYTAACVLSIIGVTWYLRPTWRALPEPTRPLARGEFWGKILPYVRWVWLTSLMANLFEIADRYMIIHFSPEGPAAGMASVGQYHSSRVVPLLLISIALLLGTMITPHLSNDWETGRRERVRLRMRMFLKLLAMVLSAGAVAVMLAEPLLFDVIFKGKFNAGREVLPYTLTYCIWFGLTLASQNYLLCAEKGRLGSLALLVGLVVNIILNRILLPPYGLEGAVWATTVANLVALSLMTTFNRINGFRLDRASLVVILAPGLLCGSILWSGFWCALMLAVVLVVIAALAPTTHWIFNDEEKHLLGETLDRYRQKIQRLRRKK